jgi:lysozyme
MKISQNGLDLIKQHESFSAVPYLCPAREWTIGWGHVVLPTESFTRITEAEALELLRKDVAITENCINQNVKALLSQDQFDALASLIFNIGISAFMKSTLLRKLNENQTT